MREQAMLEVRRGKTHRTTIPGKNGVRTGDLLNRDFTALAPNRVWITDFTHVRRWAGFIYVACVVDVFAQRIVSWHAITLKHSPRPRGGPPRSALCPAWLSGAQRRVR